VKQYIKELGWQQFRTPLVKTARNSLSLKVVRAKCFADFVFKQG
jgi:hypothetical protein